MRHLVGVVAIVIFCQLATASTSHSLGHEFLPPEHWANAALARFEALGLVELPSHRPYARDDVVLYAQQIEKRIRVRGMTLSPRDRFQLDRLRREFSNAASREDPKQRFNPPVVFSAEAPVAIEFDVDLSLQPTDAIDDDRWAFYGASNPSLRLHLGDYVTYEARYRLVMGPERGDRARDEKPSRRETSFKGLTSLYERSYVTFRWRPFTLFFGRDYVDWGPGQDGNLLLSETAQSLDKVGGRLVFKNLLLSSTHANLWAPDERRLSSHRLELRFGRLLAGVAESVVYAGRGIDPVYLFPLSSFYANQFNERDDDNVLWSLDAKVLVTDGVIVYGAYMIDDFQFEREDGTPDKVAWDVGARAAFVAPFAFGVRAQYRFVDIYTYTHRDSTTIYLTGPGDPAIDPPIGAPIGPDADQAAVALDTYPLAPATATLLFTLTRRGEGNDFRAFQSGDDPNPSFPSGVVEKTYTVGVRLLWELPRNSRASGEFAWARVQNSAHVAGVDESRTGVRLALTWDF